MKIGDLLLIRNGGAYGIYDFSDTDGDVLNSGTACILLDRIPLKHKQRAAVGPTAYYTVYCKISVNNKQLWVSEGSLQKPGHKLLWSYTKRYAKPPKL